MKSVGRLSIFASVTDTSAGSSTRLRNWKWLHSSVRDATPTLSMAVTKDSIPRSQRLSSKDMPRPTNTSGCNVSGCSGKYHVKGMCVKHYARFQNHGTTDDPRPNVEQRFWSKVEKTETCWLWRGCISNGYGMFHLSDKMVPSHRVTYEWAKGEIPAGLHIDHLCRTPKCVNPDHLEAVTPKENVLRGEGACANHARQTHCKRGHLLSGDNVRFKKNGRECRTCQKELIRNWKQDQRNRKSLPIQPEQ